MKEVMLAIVRLGDGLGLFFFLLAITVITLIAGVTVYNSFEDYHEMQVELATADKCFAIRDKKLLDGRTQSIVLNTCTGEVSMADLAKVVKK